MFIELQCDGLSQPGLHSGKALQRQRVLTLAGPSRERPCRRRLRTMSEHLTATGPAPKQARCWKKPVLYTFLARFINALKVRSQDAVGILQTNKKLQQQMRASRPPPGKSSTASRSRSSRAAVKAPALAAPKLSKMEPMGPAAAECPVLGAPTQGGAAASLHKLMQPCTAPDIRRQRQ